VKAKKPLINQKRTRSNEMKKNALLSIGQLGLSNLLRSGQRVLAASLMTAVLIGSVAVIASSPAHVSAGAALTAPQLEGTWRVTSTITDGPPPFSALYSFNGGGTLQETDEIQLLSPSAGPALGVWTKVGSNQYAFTWESYVFDLDTNMPAGRLKISGLITLIDRNTYTAVDQFQFYDADGNPTFGGCATEEATRMTVDPVTSCPAPTSQNEISPDPRSKPRKGWRY
jgi:hypothetical protein